MTQAWASAHARTARGPGPQPEKRAGGRRGRPADELGLEEVTGWEGDLITSVAALSCLVRRSGQLLVAVGCRDGDEDADWEIRDGVSGSPLSLGWDAADFGGPVRAIELAETPDSRLLLATAHPGGVEVHLLEQSEGAAGPLVCSLDISHGAHALSWGRGENGQPLLAVGGGDGSIRIWDYGTREWGPPPLSHPRAVTDLVWWSDAGDGPILLSSSLDGTVRVSDYGTDIGFGLETAEMLTSDHPTGVTAMAWVTPPDGDPVYASGDRDGRVVVRDGPDPDIAMDFHDADSPGGIVGRHRAGGPVRSLAGTILDDRPAFAAVTGNGGDIWLWWRSGDTGAGRTAQISASPGTACVALASGEGGKAFLVTGDDGGNVTVRRVSARPARELPADLGRDELSTDMLSAADVSAGDATADTGWPATAVAWTGTPDGPLLATGNAEGEVRVWDGLAGTPSRRFGARAVGMVRSLAWTVLPGGTLLLAACGRPELRAAPVAWMRTPAREWQELPWGVLRLNSDLGGGSVAWVTLPNGNALLAVGGIGGAGVFRFTGNDFSPSILRLVNAHYDPSDSEGTSVAWTLLTDGRALLAVGGPQGTRVFDGETGDELPACGTGAVNTVAWAPDEPSLLATGGADGTVRIWDGTAGTLRHTLTEHTGPVYSVAWTTAHNGQRLLASAGRYDRKTVQIWDGTTFSRLTRLPGARGGSNSLAWGSLPDGRLRLAAAPGLSRRHVRLWDIGPARRTSRPRPAATPAARPVPGSLRPAEAGLFALGRADLWLPLGLIADLVALTGGQTAAGLNDLRLSSLAEHPGVQRLRALAWPVPARLSFAGLLGRGLSLGSGYTPPADAPADSLRAALTGMVASDGPAEPAEVNIGELRAAADAVTEQLVTLLTILGPATVAADPVLPLRLAARAVKLPPITDRQLRLLGDTTTAGVTGEETGAQPRHAPGTADISRRGSLTRLLPSQLALPADLLAARLLRDQLLYRRNIAHVPPKPGPVTIILDVTPPAYGVPETILRLVAHMITTALWRHEASPTLVSLEQPDVETVLSRRGQLAGLWTTRTLNPPGPAIATALETAAHLGTPAILLSHYNAPERHYSPGPGRWLLTTHQPAEPAPPPPSHPNHFHLPPDPSRAQLAEAVWGLLVPPGAAPELSEAAS